MTTGSYQIAQAILTENSRRRKSKHQNETRDLRPLVPFYFYTPTIIAALAWAIVSGTISPLAVAGLMIAGWLIWGLFEYSFHRFVLHRQPAPKDKFSLPGNATHIAHHKDPDAATRTYVPLKEGLPIAVFFWLASWLISGSWQATAYLYAGFMIGYLVYEWIDYQAHHGKSRSRLTRYYRKYHLQHHHIDEVARYGVTSPLFDYLFGTYQLKRKPRRQRKFKSEAR